jgi:hypothetical protein
VRESAAQLLVPSSAQLDVEHRHALAEGINGGNESGGGGSSPI